MKNLYRRCIWVKKGGGSRLRVADNRAIRELKQTAKNKSVTRQKV